RLGLSDGDLDVLRNLDAEELQRQADCYIHKRYYEMAELIPASLGLIGRGARRLFRQYATDNWPEGHRRHLNDAIEFVRFAGRRGRAVDWRECGRLQRIRATLVVRSDARS
ncbi:MAG: hypothetical protein ACE5KM_20235, partial [Planctomycetaceae bacterium]